jgi:regulatory protein
MTGEGSAVNDATSGHLAPVTYLPWVRERSAGVLPAESIESEAVNEVDEVDELEELDELGRGAQPVRRAPLRRVPSTPDDTEEPSEGPDDVDDTPDAVEPSIERRGGRASGFASRRTAATRDSPSGGRRRSADVDAEVELHETGAERDDRIDRLVVSRLRRSALSVAEVRAVLVEHGLDDVEVEEWIERYERFGYLDDARLAEQVVHSHGVRRGRGSGAILQELGRRGVDASIARTVVDELDPETELENARTVAERRARQLTGLDRQTAERRLSAFLARRGYPGDVVREAVSAALEGQGS